MRRRIVFVVNHAGFFLSHRLPLALAARDAGYDVTIATPKSKHVPRIQAAGLKWERIRMSRSGRFQWPTLTPGSLRTCAVGARLGTKSSQRCSK